MTEDQQAEVAATAVIAATHPEETQRVTEDDAIDVIWTYDLFPGASLGKTSEISVVSMENLPQKCEEESRWKIMFDHVSSYEALSFYFCQGVAATVKGQLGVPLTVYPWYLAGVLQGFLGITV